MRSLLLALASSALVACGSAPPRGPAWPAPSETAEDGGESIAPRQASVVVVEKSADAEKDATPDKDNKHDKQDDKPAASSTDDGDKPEPADIGSDELETDDEVIISDEIVIEIDDE